MKVKTKCYVCGDKTYLKDLNSKEAKRIKRRIKANIIYDALGTMCDKCNKRTGYKFIGIDLSSQEDWTSYNIKNVNSNLYD